MIKIVVQNWINWDEGCTINIWICAVASQKEDIDGTFAIGDGPSKLVKTNIILNVLFVDYRFLNWLD